jgi:hypothetical protein
MKYIRPGLASAVFFSWVKPFGVFRLCQPVGDSLFAKHATFLEVIL